MNQTARILIVDDEPFNLDYLEQELDDLGYSSIRAANGWEALEKTRNQAPDMILLDVMMPEIDGFQVLGRLKADAATRDLPVIIISALNDLPSIVKGIQAGAEDYLPKPLNPILLAARVRSGLEKKRLRDQEQLYLHGLERELEIGREIQAGFLPAELPKVAGWQVASYFSAARQVAGDFYDAFTLLQANRLGVIVGDVCDKGVGAALFMTLFRSLLRASAEMDRWMAAGPDGHERDDTARLIHSCSLTNAYVMEMHGDSGMFATVFFGLLDPATGGLVYVNAGQEEPLVLSSSGIRCQLPRTGIALGALPNSVYRAGRITLEPGDTLLLLTDGVGDAENENGEAWSHERLAELLSQPEERTAHALLERIAAGVRAHMGSASQFDDITLMAIKREA